MKVGIIGAGPAGMTTAYELTKAAVSAEVFEAGGVVGGMAKSITLWGQTVDFGPHRFFSSDTRVNQIWLEVARRDYEMVNRLTRILYKGKFYYYPLRPFNALVNLGGFEALHCLTSYAREFLAPTKLSAVPTFEEWVVSRFGRRLFSIFFKTYSEKLWGIRCSDLDADFAAQRIKKFSLLEAVKSAIGFKGQTHKTLVDQFAYPHGGTGSIYARMADFCTKQGNSVHLNAPIRRVILEKERAVAVELEDGGVRRFDHIVSSMPITDLVGRFDGLPASVKQALAQLRFRNTLLVYLQIDSPHLFDDNWLYVHSAELVTGRITNFRNWVPHILGGKKETILVLEYWCYTEDAMWREPDADLIAKATAELQKSGLNSGHRVLDGHVVRIKNSYPVYVRGYKQALNVVYEYLKTLENLSVIGRYGAFKYNNQDHSILMGYLAAHNIAKGESHDLWEINTDYEYQEASVITKTGLVTKKGKDPAADGEAKTAG